MRWSDVITLIAETPAGASDTGFDSPPVETPRVVFGNKKAAWNQDFYESLQLGINTQFRFTLWKADYNGETLVRYEGKKYRVLKSDVSKNGEWVELLISDLPERGDV